MIEHMLLVDGRASGLRVGLAATFLQRARGLIGRSQRSSAAGSPSLCLRPCRAVHTLGMREAIDLAFSDAEGRVLRLIQALPPSRFRWCAGAQQVWEFPAGRCAELGIAVHSHLEIEAMP